MCTAMTLQIPQGNIYFGRTMDFSYPLAPQMYVAPKGWTWTNILRTHKIHNQYTFMGIGQDISPVVFADGVNEAGFGAMALYFPGFAQYDSIEADSSDSLSLAAVELVSFLLGQCSCVEEAAAMVRNLRIVGIRDSLTGTVAPLHWMAADAKGNCLVIEKTAEGLQLMDNPAGVLSNSPDFRWHMTNLRNYMNLSPYQQKETAWGETVLTPFGQGSGTLGLPGDFTPPSRFVRALYGKSHLLPPSSKEEAVSAFFHLMEGVSLPKGSVMTDRETADYTQYTACISLSEKTYFFRTYNNSATTAAVLPTGQDAGTQLHSIGSLSGRTAYLKMNGAKEPAAPE